MRASILSVAGASRPRLLSSSLFRVRLRASASRRLHFPPSTSPSTGGARPPAQRVQNDQKPHSQVRTGVFPSAASRFHIFTLLITLLPGCATPASLTGLPASTPVFHPENQLFYPAPLPDDQLHTSPTVPLQHVYELTDAHRTPVRPNDPLAVVLQSVRIPEHTYAGTRDLAVILDVQTSAGTNPQPLVAFYQRDVPAGQTLNFSNLLVYAVPEWDGTTPPYFRLRLLDVRAERNRRTQAALQSASRLAGDLAGLSPHPLLPLVSDAITAAGLVLSNQQNQTLLDYQVQLYGAHQSPAAGQATLPLLYTGPWLVVGREQDPVTRRPLPADSWSRPLYVDRRTGQLLGGPVPAAPSSSNPQFPALRDMPYISIAILNTDLQVPRLVLDRSQSLLSLLSSPDARSDTDALDAAASSVAAAVRQYAAERNLQRFHSPREVDAVISLMETPLPGLPAPVSDQQRRRLLRLLNRHFPADQQFPSPDAAVAWWHSHRSTGTLRTVTDPDTGEPRFQWNSNP